MKELIKLIKERGSFVIAGHSGPDGDAIGACFGLAMALESMGKKVIVVLEPFARKYNIIPGRKFLFYGPFDDLPVEVFIALDCASADRLGAVRPLFERAEVTVCIDHHETNPGFADYNELEPRASSTCEMVFSLIEQLTEVDTQIAEAIYAGMVSDTGGFRYNATQKSTMETAARLMDMGIPFTEIYNELMHKHRFAAGKALGLALNNSSQSEDGRVVYTFMTREMLASVNADPSDLDGVVEYLMGTRGALAAVFVYEKSAETQVKVSLRSQGPNVGLVAAALGGGGHVLAAGATVTGTVEEIMPQVLELISREIETAYGKLPPMDACSVPPPNEEVGGIINVYKEKGYTSHDVVAIVRKAAGRVKTGHTGTLDPDAEGVLPLCLGRATKLSEYFTLKDKTYVAEVILGVTTDTCDMSGEVLSRQDVNVSPDEITRVVESFKGEYLQTPPMYSAVKIDGKKLYDLARKGQVVERKARPVIIHGIRALEIEEARFIMEVNCSKGTYIRSLCADIGEILGCGAAMGELTRTKSGVFTLETAKKLDEIKTAAENGGLEELILPPYHALPYPSLVVEPEGLKLAVNGSSLPLELVERSRLLKLGEKCWLFDRDKRLIGLYFRQRKNLRLEVLFWK